MAYCSGTPVSALTQLPSLLSALLHGSAPPYWSKYDCSSLGITVRRAPVEAKARKVPLLCPFCKSEENVLKAFKQTTREV